VRRKPKPPPPPRPSLLDPFKPLIRERVLKDELTAVRVLEDLRGLGYRGGYCILKRFIRTFRPAPVTRPHLRFETEPGVQAQVDLSPYTVLLGEVPTDVVCFSMIFGYSRWQFIRFVLHADAHSVCHSHVLAFEEAGGVPHEILYDRMKQVVIESHRLGVVFHALFAALVQHYGYRAIPLPAATPEWKGKVEVGFLFVERNLLAGRRFHDLADLNAQAARWLREVAWPRVHRTTQERPQDRMDRERPLLLPLPPRRFEAAEREPRLVGDDFCVAWETNRYSAGPRFAGRQAWVRVLEGQLEIEVDGEPVAVHRLKSTRHERYVLPEHEEQFRKSSTSRHLLEEQFRRLGDAAPRFVEGLRERRGGAAGYHMSRILELCERAGVARVAEALRHAARYGAFSSPAVERIVAGKPLANAVPPTVATAVPSSVAEYLKGAGVHQRPLSAYERLAVRPDDAPEEHPHGQRRERMPAPESPPPLPPPRRPKPR
jgi:transposase